MTVQDSVSDTMATMDLVITRVFDAPIERLWTGWSKPEQVKQWWGPEGFSSPECRIDFREGGKYVFCMRSPEGQDYWSTGEYREITPMTRMQLTDSFADSDGNIVDGSEYGMPNFPKVTLLIIDLVELGAQTKMTFTHVGLPDNEMSAGAEPGWSGSFDKLAELLVRFALTSNSP